MRQSYRALISVTITAEDDSDAIRVARDYAASAWIRGRSQENGQGNGQVELVGETGKNNLTIERVVYADDEFTRDLRRNLEAIRTFRWEA